MNERLFNFLQIIINKRNKHFKIVKDVITTIGFDYSKFCHPLMYESTEQTDGLFEKQKDLFLTLYNKVHSENTDIEETSSDSDSDSDFENYNFMSCPFL